MSETKPMRRKSSKKAFGWNDVPFLPSDRRRKYSARLSDRDIDRTIDAIGRLAPKDPEKRRELRSRIRMVVPDLLEFSNRRIRDTEVNEIAEGAKRVQAAIDALLDSLWLRPGHSAAGKALRVDGRRHRRALSLLFDLAPAAMTASFVVSPGMSALRQYLELDRVERLRDDLTILCDDFDRVVEFARGRWSQNVAAGLRREAIQYLALAYREAVGKQPGLGRPSTGGPAGGPFHRFLTALFSVLGDSTTGRGTEQLIREIRISPHDYIGQSIYEIHRTKRSALQHIPLFSETS